MKSEFVLEKAEAFDALPPLGFIVDLSFGLEVERPLLSSTVEVPVPLYRAVSLDELLDIEATGQFRVLPGCLECKQFGLALDEIVQLAGELKEAVAVVRVLVPKSAIAKFDSTPVDSHILKSGCITVCDGEPLRILNQTLLEVIHVF